MRRVFGLVVAVGLLATMFALPAAASPVGGVAVSAGDMILAVAGGDDLGPEPQPRLAEDNQARELAGYDDPEVPFTWGAAWILTFTGMAGLALLGGLYWLLVYRPSRRATASG